MTSTMYLPPGQSPVTLEFHPERRGPGFWIGIMLVVLVVALPAAACFGFTGAASLIKPTPTLGTSTPTSTGTLRPTAMPTITFTATPRATITARFVTDIPTATIRPTATPCVTYYRVKSGDYLNSIAGRYQVSPGSIARLNSLGNPDRLLIGTVLAIPVCILPTARPYPSPYSGPTFVLPTPVIIGPRQTATPDSIEQEAF